MLLFYSEDDILRFLCGSFAISDLVVFTGFVHNCENNLEETPRALSVKIQWKHLF